MLLNETKSHDKFDLIPIHHIPCYGYFDTEMFKALKFCAL